MRADPDHDNQQVDSVSKVLLHQTTARVDATVATLHHILDEREGAPEFFAAIQN